MIFKLQAPPTGEGKDQVKVLHDYLFTLQRELNMALNQLTPDKLMKYVVAEISKGVQDGEVDVIPSVGNVVDRFNNLKALIIKTADVIDSRMDTLIEQFSGKYVAQNEFGTYQQETIQTIITTATEITQSFNFISETVLNETLETMVVDTEQYIKSGLLYYEGSVPRYGVAIGEKMTIVEVDGERILTNENVAITVTANRINFWQNGIVISYYESNKLYVKEAVFDDRLRIGNWVFDDDAVNGLTIKWGG